MGEMDAFRGVMLMVAGGPVFVVLEELPPQRVRKTLVASKHISAAVHRAVLQVRRICMIFGGRLGRAQVQNRSLSAFNPACLRKLLTARRADAPRVPEKSSVVTSVPEPIRDRVKIL